MHNYGESVTVLMPVYNAAGYLHAAIESIRRQTYSEFEFLIVDDGSTDGSGDVLQRFAGQDSRICIIRGMHEGVAAARNRGLAQARGSIVICMDADDIAMPERIELQLAYLTRHPDVAAVGSALRLINKDGDPLAPPTKYPLTAEEIRESLHMGHCALGQPTVAMRREAAIAVGGYRRAFDPADDYDLWIRLSERHALANMPEVLVDYRWHGSNTTARQRRRQVLGAHIAKLAAAERRLGRPDPTSGLEKLCVADLDRFDLPRDARAAILQELSEAGLVAYDATGEARHLADVLESLFAQGHPRGARARAVATRLVQHLWRAGEYPRSIAAVGWKLRAEMSSVARHAVPLLDTGKRRSRRAVAKWLIRCADPLGPRGAPPRRRLSLPEVRELVVQADQHGVLPAVLRNYPPFQGDAAFADAKADALTRHRAKLTYSLMLRTHGEALMAAAAGLPVAMVKGPVFARTIYPLPGLRNFTDIDLLVAPEAEPRLARVLEEQGYRLAEYDRDLDRQEWKWLHRDNDALMIEVHTNLVHHRELRQAMSLSYENLAGIAETPAALLTVAVVHGALERYELLRHVVDVCQAARRLDTTEEERRFEALVQKAGARFAAIAGLDLGYRLFGEPRCRELARGLGPVRYTALAQLLLGRTAITSTMSDTRFLHSWRRQGFRILLKRSGAS
jgi:glycosyl transferase family 2/putative nucleotidyltransferase-like protein